MMRNYKMLLAYDGGRYNGWQKQGNTDNTIQEKLEGIVSALAGCPIEVYGSGRTDAGTHAYGQVANFHMNWEGTAEKLMDCINEKLPEDMAVLSLESVSPRFHSRLSAKGKIYEYTIWNSKKPPVFERKYVFWCEKPLHLEKMKEASQAFLGEHDFKSFCANKRMKKSTVRKIYEIQFLCTEDKITISYHGNGFLYQMVRILTGTLIEVGEGKRQPEEISAILAALDREKAGFTAPAKGLVLREVFYGEGREENDSDY
ncbi:tRNA pseudouridine synthase A [Anaerotignum neopropionicum]|uniref:tRNA pseudouridine synthase A n=2 Tax=Anaerotignum neopropionicum TaxID=36847 RepID=A0A136WAZ1_9FIRM|nr:tRNA pseudouridine(38-40) synthase TruA [Anaerotignum neopropionicum]KXL51685.1 tRNA pseudouridine synthase A [Anaerotignum neopropionicum]